MCRKAKKQQKRDFTKLKSVLSKVFKVCKKVLTAVVGISSLIAFLVVPFLNNCIDHTLSKWIWYPACAIFILSAILELHNSNKMTSNNPLFNFIEKISLLPTVMIFGNAFLINYYHVAFSWWWAGFVIFAVYFPVFMFGIRKYLEKEKNYTPEQIKKSQKNCLKYVLFYWLIDLFYMSIFNYWQTSGDSHKVWFALQFIFGGLAMVYIFYNLTRVFLANGEKHWWGLLQDFVLGILTTIYLIFLLPNDSGLQSITATIIAAVYGGLLTLIGVAWTIRRQDDINREQEKKAYRPIAVVQLDLPREVVVLYIKKVDCNTISFDKNEICSIPVYIQTVFLSNTDFCNFYLLGLIVNGEKILVEPKQYIQREKSFAISFNQKVIYTKNSINKISLYTQDLLGNFYEIPLSYEIVESDALEQTYEKLPKPPKILNNKITQIHVIDEQTAIEIRSNG